MKIYYRINIIDLMRNDVNVINNKRDLGGNFLKVKQKVQMKFDCKEG